MSAPVPEAPRVSWPFVVLAGIVTLALVALVLGLVITSGAEGRADSLAWLSNVITLIVGGGVVGVGAQVRKVGQTAEKVQHQTNGALDRRLRDAMDTAVTTALERAGVLDVAAPRHQLEDDTTDQDV